MDSWYCWHQRVYLWSYIVIGRWWPWSSNMLRSWLLELLTARALQMYWYNTVTIIEYWLTNKIFWDLNFGWKATLESAFFRTKICVIIAIRIQCSQHNAHSKTDSTCNATNTMPSPTQTVLDHVWIDLTCLQDSISCQRFIPFGLSWGQALLHLSAITKH